MVLMIGESATTARQIADTPPWRIGSATAAKLAAAEAHRDQVAGVAVDVDRRAVDLRHRRHRRQAEERARRHQGTAREAGLQLGALQLVAPAVRVGRDPPGPGEAQLAGAELQRLVGEDLDHGQSIGGHAARAAAGLGHQQEMIGGLRRQRRQWKADQLDRSCRRRDRHGGYQDRASEVSSFVPIATASSSGPHAVRKIRASAGG